MPNIVTKIEKNKLIITVDLKETHGLSKSKKTIIIASTNGNVPIDGSDGAIMGINIYRKNPDYKPE